MNVSGQKCSHHMLPEAHMLHHNLLGELHFLKMGLLPLWYDNLSWFSLPILGWSVMK